MAAAAAEFFCCPCSTLVPIAHLTKADFYVSKSSKTGGLDISWVKFSEM